MKSVEDDVKSVEDDVKEKLSKYCQRNAKLEFMMIRMLSILSNVFRKVYKDTYEETWENSTQNRRKEIFDDAFREYLTKKNHNDDKRKIEDYSLASLDLNKLITLTEYVHETERLEKYENVPKAMKILKNINNTSSYNLRQNDDLIWDQLDLVFKYLNLEKKRTELADLRKLEFDIKFEK